MSCPDFLFLLNDVCVCRGVEKRPDIGISRHQEKLIKGLVWVYGEMPYVFAYVASGYRIKLLAVVVDGSKTSNVRSVCIGSFNLERLGDRIRFLLALFNLSLLFTTITEHCPDSGKGEFQTIASDGMVRLYPTFVEKFFPPGTSLRHLEIIYDKLEKANVPNVDRIVKVNSDEDMVVFKPRGMSMKPSNVLELFVALRNVIEALVILHRMRWIHRDIRWPNVMKHRECDKRFLIDFEDAAPSPQKFPSGEYLSSDEHAPEIFVHGDTHNFC